MDISLIAMALPSRWKTLFVFMNKMAELDGNTPIIVPVLLQ
jgi:hypothetical protein